MLLVIPVSRHDLPLALLNLRLAARLDRACPFPLLISAPNGLDIDELLTAAERWSTRVSTFRYDDWQGDPAWPRPQNWAWQSAARFIATLSPSPNCWLWWEADATPLKGGWMTTLANAYAHGAKPFAGHVVAGENHLNGVALYPADVRPFSSAAFLARSAPFDRVLSRDLGGRHITALNDLMGHYLKPPGRPSWPATKESVVALRASSAVLFHGSSDGALVKALLGGSLPPAVASPPLAHSYYHSGDLGDIIYALAAIELAGGGHLALGPVSRGTPPPRSPLSADQFERLARLLRAQSYLKSVTYTPTYSATATDLNVFRAQWGDKGLRASTGISTLVEMHCHTIGVRERFKGAPWISVPSATPSNYYVVHRSARYRNDAFPWALVVRRYRDKLLFVGHEAEHADFERLFLIRLPFWKCADFLDLARLIAGARGFIGNQSFPNALALSLGQRVLQESWPTSPDCALPRPNVLTQPFDEARLTEWESSSVSMDAPAKGKWPWPFSRPARAEVVSQQRRLVSRTPIKGLIELGPQRDAHGLGDTLAITPLAARLGKKAVMCLPPSLSRFAPLFEGLCPTRITEDYPEFVTPAKERFIESKLRMFGYACVDGEVAPVIKLTDAEKKTALNWFMEQPREGRDVVFHTACSKEWMHIRSRPAEWFTPVETALQHNGLYPVVFEPTVPLRELAARYYTITRYCGVNTGNWHLAMAAGCRCLVIDADECDGYEPSLWRYSLPSCEYVGFDTANIIAKLPWLLEGSR